MESRKMVLMNLFAGKKWRCRHRDRTQYGKEKVGQTEKVASAYIHYLV